MKRIVGILHPFDLMQTFYIYEDGNKTDVFRTSIQSLPETVVHYAKKYGITQINFSGPEHYAKGIIKKIQTIEVEQYQTNNLTFNCI